ncbi:uncharacterized protein LOC123396283 [Hordeum vulgare subsp. vulgare]|uniref:uncharacterized protein LOC123396283 n=1 Tax=Hordeum vulgare subsp. vulgare TaxID=112509 RepID=UPI001D1A3A9C|nr:uncharacterized protein LOC123396283 [Hordeum vulgare subsp. vulgare]
MVLLQGCGSGGGGTAGGEPRDADSRSRRCSPYAALPGHTTPAAPGRGRGRKTASVMVGCESGGGHTAGVEPWTADSRSHRCSPRATDRSVHATPLALGRCGDRKRAPVMVLCESGGGDKAGVEPWTPDSRSQRCSPYAALAGRSVHTTLVSLRHGGNRNRKTAPVMVLCESGGGDKAGVEPWTPDSRSQRCSLYAALADRSVHTKPTDPGRGGDWRLTTFMDVVGNGRWSLGMEDGDETRGYEHYTVKVRGHGQFLPALAHVFLVRVPLLRCVIPTTLVQGGAMLMVLACARTGSRNWEVVKAAPCCREGGGAPVVDAHHHRCDTRSLSLVLLLMNATEVASQELHDPDTGVDALINIFGSLVGMPPRVLEAGMMLNLWFKPHDRRIVEEMICVPQQPAIKTMIPCAAFPVETKGHLGVRNVKCTSQIVQSIVMSICQNRWCIIVLVISLLIRGAAAKPVLEHGLNTTLVCPAYVHQFKSPLKTNWLGEQYDDWFYMQERNVNEEPSMICTKLSGARLFASLAGAILSFIANLGPLNVIRKIGEVSEPNRKLYGFSSICLASSYSSWVAYLLIQKCKKIISIALAASATFIHTGYWLFFLQPSRRISIAIFTGSTFSSVSIWAFGGIADGALSMVAGGSIGIFGTSMGHLIRVALAPKWYCPIALSVAAIGGIGNGSFLYKTDWSIMWYKIGLSIACVTRVYDFIFQIYYLCAGKRKVPIGTNDLAENLLPHECEGTEHNRKDEMNVSSESGLNPTDKTNGPESANKEENGSWISKMLELIVKLMPTAANPHKKQKTDTAAVEDNMDTPAAGEGN